MKPNWRRSRFCSTNGQCVELAQMGSDVLVRDSKDVTGPSLGFSGDEFAAFLTAVKAGDYDDLV